MELIYAHHKLYTYRLRVTQNYVLYKLYGRVLEMPQKVCGGDILHVMAFV